MPSSDDTHREPAQPRNDPLLIQRRQQSSARSPRQLPGVVLAAVRIVREAAPTLFAMSIALSVATAGILGVQIVLSKVVISSVLDGARTQGSAWSALPAVAGLVIASGMGSFAASAQAHLQRLLSERVQQSMWASIFEVTTSVDLATFEDPAFFDDLQRVRTNAVIQPAALAQGLLALLSGLLSVGGLAVGLLLLEPLLVPVLLLGAVPAALITRRSGRLEFGFQLDQTPLARLRFYLVGVLCGRDEAKEIRAFGLAETLTARWTGAYETYQGDLARHVRRRVALALLGAGVGMAVSLTALMLLLAFVYAGDLPLASAGAALVAVRLLGGRLESSSTGVGRIFEASLFVSDYQRFLTRRPDAPPPRQEVHAPFGVLEVDHVSFTYPGSAQPALRSVSLQIRAGETVALVGENGSGKTTLAKILAQLLEPSAGEVRWDDADTRELDGTTMREHIGVIFQDFMRYQLSARENVALGRPGPVDPERLSAAAKAAGADGFLSRLPAGYDTLLGKEFAGGHDLSLGQWQRVALARAFYRDAGFLVLDEPTSSLDARSEHELFEYVRRLAQGRSLLLISHRFSTVMSADRIYVLHHGEVVEAGSHEQLMARGGRYAELFELQARSYRDDLARQ
jgi:ATP-binding cassette subfamily B protein